MCDNLRQTDTEPHSRAFTSDVDYAFACLVFKDRWVRCFFLCARAAVSNGRRGGFCFVLLRARHFNLIIKRGARVVRAAAPLLHTHSQVITSTRIIFDNNTFAPRPKLNTKINELWWWWWTQCFIFYGCATNGQLLIGRAPLSQPQTPIAKLHAIGAKCVIFELNPSIFANISVENAQVQNNLYESGGISSFWRNLVLNFV